MAEGTAVVEAPPEPPPLLPIEGPETETQDVVTTPPETEAKPPSPWEGKTPEEIDAELQKRSKDIEARVRESERRKNEEARKKEISEAQEQLESQQYATELSAAQQNLARGAYDSFDRLSVWLVEQTEKGEKIDRQALAGWWAQLSNTLSSSLVAVHTDLASEGLLSQLTRDGITIPAKETMAITRARKVATRNPAGYFQALADGVRAGLKESLREELRAEIEAESAEKDKERQIKAAEERRKVEPSPTGGGETPMGSRTARQILDDPNSSIEARKKALFAETGYQM